MFERFQKLFGGAGKHRDVAPLKLQHPDDEMPWENTSLPRQQRLDIYKGFVCEKLQAIESAYTKATRDTPLQREIREAVETQKWLKEAERIQDMTAEEFCRPWDDRAVIRQVLGKHFLGADAWRSQAVEVGKEPLLPDFITPELVLSVCPFHPRGLIKDTHVLVLVPKTVNGEPYSLLKLEEICAVRQRSEHDLILRGGNLTLSWQRQPFVSAVQNESEWVLLPKRDPNPAVVPDEKHFRGKNSEEQQKVQDTHYKKYREARVLELVTAAALNDLVHGVPRMIGQSNFLDCQETSVSGNPVCVTGFGHVGVLITEGLEGVGNPNGGRALVRIK